jgi:hypothetical protein
MMVAHYMQVAAWYAILPPTDLYRRDEAGMSCWVLAEAPMGTACPGSKEAAFRWANGYADMIQHVLPDGLAMWRDDNPGFAKATIKKEPGEIS